MTPSPPPILNELAPEWTATLAYRLKPGITTWRLVHPDGRVRFAKVDSTATFPPLRAEAERMVWAAAYLPVPTVVTLHDAPGVTVLITEGLPGRDGTDDGWRDDLPGLVVAFARGLRAFHGAVEEEWCPFRFELERALDHVARRVEANDIDPSGFQKEYQHLTPGAAFDQLRAMAPTSEDLVVCHGDYCPPNVLLSDRQVTGYVDLGELGVADRWWDIARGGWSTVWNFGEEYEPLFYEAYGIVPDTERIAFYRLLSELAA